MRFKWLIKLEAHPFLRNFSLLTVGNFGSRFISMVTNIIVARFLAPERYGEYSLVLTYMSMFYFVASLGLNQLVTRSVARDKDNSDFYFRLSMLLRLLGFAVSILAFYGYALVTGKDFSTFIILSILGGVFLESIWEGQQNVAFGMQRMEWNTIVGIGSSFLILIVYLCLPRTWFSVESVLAIYLAVYLLKNVAYYCCLKRFNLLRLSDSGKKITYPVCRDYLVESMPFYMMFLLGLFTGQFPILFLERNSSLEEVAFFNTANKLLLPITLFMSTAFSAFFPNQSILYANDKLAFSKQTKKVLVLVCGLGIYLALSITLFKSEIVRILYGEAYAATANVLAYQSWYVVMYGIFSLNANTLGAADAQRKLAICSIVYAIISTPILYFSSKFGADGLAIGFVVASVLNLTYIMPVLKNTVGGVLTWRFSVRLLLMLFFAVIISVLVFDVIPLLWRIVLFVFMSSALFLERKRIIAQLR